ncbi:autophagy-related protein 22-like protein [Lactarius vividus]|nr:autophagy-related protein 22-like protein [Lactarius vividus]
MISDTRDSKDDPKVNLDIEGSQVGKQTPDVTVSERGQGLWATTSRRELWCFYLYYVGNNGLSGFNFGPSQFQNLLYLAGYDPSHPPFSAPCGSVNSIVLLTNGISFAIQAVLLLTIGGWADYGTWRPNITIFFTVLAVGVSFAWLGVEDPSQWRTGVALYVLGCASRIFYSYCLITSAVPVISYQGALTFWTAAFPGLARNLPEVQDSADEAKRGLKLSAPPFGFICDHSLTGRDSSDDHSLFESLARNRVSNISFAISSAGEIIILAIMVGILKGLHADASPENNTKAFSVLIAFSGGVWLICAIPWFIFEKRRPGLALPPGTSFVTIGFKQAYVALRECLRLKQTFLGDVLNTTVTVIGTLQNSVVAYSTLQLTLLLLVGIVTQGLGIYIFWLVQKKYHITTKTMLVFNVFWILVLTAWGLAGVHTNKIGFKHVWEIWLYQVFYGLMVCPWYAYSQTMISEVSPLPQMFLFFALFSVVGKTSAFIGPFVSEAIISASNNNDNMPFAFLFGLGLFSTIFLFMVDVKKSRIECEEFVEAEATRDAFATSNM